MRVDCVKRPRSYLELVGFVTGRSLQGFDVFLGAFNVFFGFRRRGCRLGHWVESLIL